MDVGAYKGRCLRSCIIVYSTMNALDDRVEVKRDHDGEGEDITA